jgi:anti-sigma factor RsiW
MQDATHEIDHERCIELLPEYTNGRLDTPLSHRVQAHVPNCEECRQAQWELLHIRDALSKTPASLEPILTHARQERNLNHLLQRIDASAARSPITRRRRGFGQWADVPRGFQFAFLAQSVALAASLVLAIRVGWPWVADRAEYQTFMEQTPGLTERSTPRYRVVFADGAAEGDIRALLHSLGLHFDGGPSLAGAYTLVADDARATPTEVTAALRASQWIRLAEVAVH